MKWAFAASGITIQNGDKPQPEADGVVSPAQGLVMPRDTVGTQWC